METKKKQAAEAVSEEREEEEELAGEIAEAQADRLKWAGRKCGRSWQSESKQLICAALKSVLSLGVFSDISTRC